VTTLYIIENSRAIRDEDGNTLYYEGTAEDITERKKREDILKESEEKYRTLVANIPGAVYRCANDADWTMEFFSETIEDISGYPAGEFIRNRVRLANSSEIGCEAIRASYIPTTGIWLPAASKKALTKSNRTLWSTVSRVPTGA